RNSHALRAGPICARLPLLAMELLSANKYNTLIPLLRTKLSRRLEFVNGLTPFLRSRAILNACRLAPTVLSHYTLSLAAATPTRKVYAVMTVPRNPVMPARNWLAGYARLKGNSRLPGEHC